VEFTPGVWVDPRTGVAHHYDRVQRNIRHNHLAVVEDGREGPLVKIRLDSKGARLYSEIKTNPQEEVMAQGVNEGNPQQGQPVKMKFNEEELEVHPSVAAHINAMEKKTGDLQAKVNEMEATLNSLKEAKEKAEKEGKENAATCNSLKGELEGMKSRANAADDPEKFSKAVSARVELLSEARSMVGEAKFDELKLNAATDLEVMKAAIRLHDDKAELDEQPAEFIRGMFKAMKTTRTNSGEDLGHEILGQAGAAGAGSSFSEAVEKAKEKARNAWKNPVGFTRDKALQLTAASQAG
jgi:hypothetical protein